MLGMEVEEIRERSAETEYRLREELRGPAHPWPSSHRPAHVLAAHRASRPSGNAHVTSGNAHVTASVATAAVPAAVPASIVCAVPVLCSVPCTSGVVATLALSLTLPLRRICFERLRSMVEHQKILGVPILYVLAAATCGPPLRLRFPCEARPQIRTAAARGWWVCERLGRCCGSVIFFCWRRDQHAAPDCRPHTATRPGSL